MRIASPAETSTLAQRWETLRDAARARGLSVKRIAELAGVPVRTVNDMFQPDWWNTRTLANLARVETAIEAALRDDGGEERPGRVSDQGFEGSNLS